MTTKIYYDIGVNNDNGFPTIRFSNDGTNYFYVEFGTMEEFETFVERIVGILKFLKSIP